ncbi:MAG: hypothetical protein IV100_00535 [Myxococcales bacterium]|nr:hypothetical protein [Myxococcales bacterium]
MSDAAEVRTKITDKSIFRERIEALVFGEDPPQITVDGVICAFRNISMGGTYVTTPPQVPVLEPRAEVSLRVAMEDEVLYGGPAYVVRSEEAPLGRAVALEVAEGFIDISRLKDLSALASMKRAAASYRSGRSKIPSEFSVALEAIVDFHRYYRAMLAPKEDAIRVEGARTEDALIDLASSARDLMIDQWHELRDRAAAAALPHANDEATWMQMKRATERQLTHELMGAPLVERAYRKPLLYAGDFRTMTFIYRNELEGRSVTDRIFHWFAGNEALAEGVRTRKGMMKQLIIDEEARVAALDRRPLRVTSLGCGPALEVRELAHDESWSGEVTWTLVDQEVRALSIAYGDNFAALRRPGRNRGDIRCLNLTLRNILKERWMPSERQDFIYAAGLFDYLSTEVATRLITLLASNLAPGGLIAIGNARVDPVNYWMTEFVVDWKLLYRTEPEMFALVEGLKADFDVKLVMEPAKAYWFLLLRRR